MLPVGNNKRIYCLSRESFAGYSPVERRLTLLLPLGRQSQSRPTESRMNPSILSYRHTRIELTSGLLTYANPRICFDVELIQHQVRKAAESPRKEMVIRPPNKEPKNRPKSGVIKDARLADSR